MEPTQDASSTARLGEERTIDPTEQDRQILERERGHGDADGARIRHVLGVPSQDAAEALAAIVRNEAHDAEVEGPTDDALRPWRVIATSEGQVSDELAGVAERRFTELAAEHGGRYEGWEAAV